MRRDPCNKVGLRFDREFECETDFASYCTVTSCVETAKFGAIVVVESIVDGTMLELACLILGFW
jgi:hypothetical protein